MAVCLRVLMLVVALVSSSDGMSRSRSRADAAPTPPGGHSTQGPDSPTVWAFKTLAGAGASWGVGQLLTLITAQPDPAGELQRRISDIDAQVKDLKATVSAINVQLGRLETLTLQNSLEVLKEIRNTRVDDVKNMLDQHYVQPFYDPSRPNTACADKECLQWFLDKARTEAGRKSVREQDKTDFAYRVLHVWDFRQQAQEIFTAITSTEKDKGVLEVYGAWMALADTDAAFFARYLQMQAYFNQLIGMQVHCMTLVTTAYAQLENVPAYRDEPRPDPGTGERWRTGVYAEMIKSEFERFRNVVETAAMRRIQIPFAFEPSAAISGDVQEVLARLDFVLARGLEPNFLPGLRVRLLVNPDFNEQLTITSTQAEQTGTSWLSPTDPRWQTVIGPKVYDSWGWRSGTSQWPQFKMQRVFQLTDRWKMFRTGPGAYHAGDAVVTLSKPLPGWSDVQQRATVRWLDDNYQPTAPGAGSLFGSVTIIKRATAHTMLDPCTKEDVQAVGLFNTCGASIEFPECNRSVINLCYRAGAAATFDVAFAYVGSEPVNGRFWLAWTRSFGGDATQCNNVASPAFFILYDTTNLSNYIVLRQGLDGFSSAVDTTYTWEPGHRYTYRLQNNVTSSNRSCNGILQYHGALMVR